MPFSFAISSTPAGGLFGHVVLRPQEPSSIREDFQKSWFERETPSALKLNTHWTAGCYQPSSMGG